MKKSKYIGIVLSIVCVVGTLSSCFLYFPEVVDPDKLGIPIITVENCGFHNITIAWDEIYGAESGYDIFWGKQGPGSIPVGETEQCTIAYGTTHYNLTNLDYNEDYYIWVRAVNSKGFGQFGSTKAQTCNLASPVLSVSVAQEQLVVSWQSYADATDGYELYWTEKAIYAGDDPVSEGIGGAAISQGTPGAMIHHTIASLTGGTEYVVWVRAKALSDSSVYSAFAQMCIATIVESPVITVTNKTAQSLSLEWASVVGASSYVVVWSDNAVIPETLTGANSMTIPGGAGAVSTTLTGLSQHTVYYIWVQAKGSAIHEGLPNDSVYGTTSSLTLLATPQPVLQSSHLAVDGMANANIGWSAIANANTYEIYYMEKGLQTLQPDNPPPAAILSTESVSNTDPVETYLVGLEFSTTYYVWVRATSTVPDNHSDWGMTAIETRTLPAPVIRSVKGEIESGTGKPQLNLDWTRSTMGATTIEIYYSPTNLSDDDVVSTASKLVLSDITATEETVRALTASAGLLEVTEYFVWMREVRGTAVSPWAKSSALTCLRKPSGATSHVDSISFARNQSTADGFEFYLLPLDALDGTYSVYYQPSAQELAKYNTFRTGPSNVFTYSTPMRGSTWLLFCRAYKTVAGVTYFSEFNSRRIDIRLKLGLISIVPGVGELEVNWSSLSNATGGYELYYSSTYSGAYPEYETSGVTLITLSQQTGTISKTISGLTPGTSYTVWIRALATTYASNSEYIKKTGTPN